MTENVNRRRPNVQTKTKSAKHNSPKSHRKRKSKNSQRKLRKVFVDGISRDTTEDMIYKYFMVFGPIEEVAKLQHRCDPEKYYAFVVYESISATRLATANPCPVIGKDVAYCALAAIGERYSGYDYFRKIKMLDEKQQAEKKIQKPKIQAANGRRSASESHSLSAGTVPYITTEGPYIPRGLSLFGMGTQDPMNNHHKRSITTPQVYARQHLGLGQLRVDVNDEGEGNRQRTHSAGSVCSISFTPTYTPSTSSHGVSPGFMRRSPLTYAYTPGAQISYHSHSSKGAVTPNYTPGGGLSMPHGYKRHHSQSYTRMLTPPTAPFRLNDVARTRHEEYRNFGAYLPQM